MFTSRTSRFLSDLGSSAPRVAVARRLVLLLSAGLLVAACNRSAQTTNGSAERHYEARGIIRGISPDRKTVDVEHEDIRGFMPSMTMPFSVHDPKQIAGLRIGDAISFRLSVTDQDSWIDQVKKISANEVRLPAPTATPEIRSTSNALPRLREGDVMPPFELIDQGGKKIDMEKFRGHPLVLTFIFTRCPLPNFCPLMSKNFAELQTAIKNGSGMLAQTRLLSVSFDPDFDSPQILKAYAEHEQTDPNIWTFATGNKSEIEDLTHEFSVYVQREGGTISHGLATALIDQDGKIDKIWRGNGWRPAEVLREVR
jgi:protein SCO1/2